MAIDWKQTGRLVAQKRAAAGLTQFQLAERLGISVRALSELERGLIRRASAQIKDASERWLGRKLPEVGAITPIPPEPTPIPRRQDIGESARRITILATSDPAFWIHVLGIINGHLACLGKVEAAARVKPRIVRTGRRRRLLNELNGPEARIP